MRIVHCVNSLGCGGAENLVLDLANEMRQAGHEVLIISLSDTIEYRDKLQRYGLSVITCGFTGSIYHWKSLLNTQRIFSSAIQKFKPDVIHSHIFLSDLFARLNKPAGCVLITTLHRDEPWWSSNRVISKIKTFIEGFAARRYTDRFIAVSSHAKSEAVRALGIAAERCRVVMNGVDLLAFSRGPKNKTLHKPVIIQVARFYPEKSHQLSLAGFAELVRSVPDVQLWLVGDGPLRNDMEALADQLQISSQVSFLGVRQDVADLLVQADIFLLSSEREGLPISILEALASGVPVVSSAVGEIPNILTHGKTGMLFKSGDKQAMVAHLLALLQTPAFAEQIADAGLQLVREKYSIASTAKIYLQEYQHAVASR